MALTFPPAPKSSACGNPADRDYAALSSSLDNAYTCYLGWSVVINVICWLRTLTGTTANDKGIGFGGF